MVTAAAPTAATETSPTDVVTAILFFDGECGFCDRAIRFAMSRDAHRRLFAATLAGDTARVALAPFAAQLVNVDSTVLYRPASTSAEATVAIYSDAALAVLRILGGGWAILAVLGRIVPRSLRDAAYKSFARRRFQLFGRVEACQLWPSEWRSRMLP